MCTEYKQSLVHKATWCPRIKKMAMKGFAAPNESYKSVTMSLSLHRIAPKQTNISKVVEIR